MSPTYTLEYELKREDALAALREALRRKGLLWLFSQPDSLGWRLALFILSVIVGLLVPFLLLSLIDRFDPGSVGIEARILAYVVGLAASFYFINTRLKHANQELLERTAQKQAPGTRKLIISSEEIAMQGPRGEAARNWSAVRRIDATESHAFIWSDVVFVIPSRALSDPDDFQRLVESIRRWHADAPSI